MYKYYDAKVCDLQTALNGSGPPSGALLPP